MGSFAAANYDNFEDIVFILEGDDLVFSYVNKSFVEAFGSPSIGDSIESVFRHIDYTSVLAMLNAGAKGEAARLTIHMDTTTADQQSDAFALKLLCTPLHREGQPNRLLLIGEKTHFQPDAPLDINSAFDHFLKQVEVLDLHLWISFPSGDIYWFNRSLCDYCGRSLEELRNGGWMQVVHPDDLLLASQKLSEAVTTASFVEAPLRVQRHDGAYRWFISRATPIKNFNGDLIYFLGCNVDIHDRMLSEEQTRLFAATLEERVEARTSELMQAQEILRHSQRMETVGNLAGGVAHDFNNILQVVSGSCTLLQRALNNPDKAQLLIDNIKDSVQRGARLSSQLLSLARLNPVERIVMDTKDTLEKFKRLLTKVVNDDITITHILPEDSWSVFVDQFDLENAILNLVVNARDAINGKGEITIELVNHHQPPVASGIRSLSGDHVAISVRDTGCGIASDLFDKIYEPFYTTKQKGRGTGLGLPMVKAFAIDNGGDLMVESTINVGTKFTILLPRNSDQMPALRPAPGPITTGHERILLVEDELQVRDTVATMLRHLNYEVVVASLPADAIRFAQNGISFDLILTDVMMPGPISSTDMVEELRGLIPGAKILFMSGYAENLVTSSKIIEPDVNLLRKPFTEQEIAARLREVLNEVPRHKTNVNDAPIMPS